MTMYLNTKHLLYPGGIKTMNNSEHGSLLISIIIAMIVISALGAGIASMVTTGVRSSTDHSLSIQALYLAESGFEWAGKKLREHDNNEESWEVYCSDDLKQDGEDMHLNDNNYFIILSANNSTNGCTINALGWVGSGNKGNALASRRINGEIPKDFIETEIIPDANTVGGEGEEITPDIGNNERVFVLPGTTIKGDVTIPNFSKVYFQDDVRVESDGNKDGDVDIKPHGYAYFGNNFYTEGSIIIKNKACFKDDITIEKDLTIQTSDNYVCFGNNITVNGDIDNIDDTNICFGYNPPHSLDYNNIKKSSICFKGDLNGYTDISCDYDGIHCGGCLAGDCPDCEEVCIEKIPYPEAQDPNYQGDSWSEE